MKNVLILGGTRVQKDAIDYLESQKYNVHVCSYPKGKWNDSEYVKYNEINIFDKQGLEKYILANSIEVIYSVGLDFAMPVASGISEALSLPYFVNCKTAWTCNHKEEMRKTLDSDFEGNVQYEVLNECKKVDIPFPCIVKPNDSQGQRGVYKVDNQKELEDVFEKSKSFSNSKEVIVEQFIDGKEVSVNGYMVNGNIRFFIVSERVTWEKYTGLIHKHVIAADIVKQETKEKIKNICTKACQKLGINNGPFYVQMKIENEKPYIIEITPRLDGCHMFKLIEKAAGINLMKLSFDHLLRNDISELDKEHSVSGRYELEFFCEKPDTVFSENNYIVPDDCMYKCFYYNNEETIIAKNGLYEKVGYFIKKYE